MKVLLTRTKSTQMKGGVEVFSDHLATAFPGLTILEYESLRSRCRDPLPLWKEPVYAKRLARELRSLPTPEAVFSSGLFGWSLRDPPCPVVNIQHGTFAGLATAAMKRRSLDYWRTRYVYAHYERLSARRATVTVANSPFTAAHVRHYYGADPLVIPNAIDDRVMRPVPQGKAREALGLPHDKTIALFVGRPDETKGFDIVQEVAEQRPDILMVCVFPRPQPLPRGNMAAFSSIPHAQLRLFYSAADVCLNPSRFDGFGYVPLEALACARPVIGTATGIFAGREMSGFTPAPLSARAYCAILSRAIPSPGSRRAIVREFSLALFARRYRALLKTLVEDDRYGKGIHPGA